MPLQVIEVANQLLDQIRVVSNGPILEEGEPLRVDVIPPGATSEATGLVQALPLYDLNVLSLSVTYAIFRTESDGTTTALAEGDGKDYLRVPHTAGNPLAELLSVAFVLKPRLKFDPKPLPKEFAIPEIGLPKLDHRLHVTIKISSPVLPDPGYVTKTIVLAFTVPTVSIPLPVVPAVCICSKLDELKLSGVIEGGEVDPGQFLVMVAPGGPSSLNELAAAYNQVMDVINSLKSVFSMASVVLEPLQKLADALGYMPQPYLTTDQWVLDFDKYNSFDDRLSSFLLVAPTGTTVQFASVANPGSWDDSGGHLLKKYTAIDLLQLGNLELSSSPTDEEKQLKATKEYILDRLGVSSANITTLANQIAILNGISFDAAKDLELGLGIFYMANLDNRLDINTAAADVVHLLYYDNDPSEPVWKDPESARWIPASN